LRYSSCVSLSVGGGSCPQGNGGDGGLLGDLSSVSEEIAAVVLGLSWTAVFMPFAYARYCALPTLVCPKVKG
jgi:hypothetical protein